MQVGGPASGLSQLVLLLGGSAAGDLVLRGRDEDDPAIAEARVRRLQARAGAEDRRQQQVQDRRRDLALKAEERATEQANVERFLADRAALEAAERRIAEARPDPTAPRGSVIDILG